MAAFKQRLLRACTSNSLTNLQHSMSAAGTLGVHLVELAALSGTYDLQHCIRIIAGIAPIQISVSCSSTPSQQLMQRHLQSHKGDPKPA